MDATLATSVVESSPPATPVFDIPSLVDRCMGETSLAKELLKMFRDRLHCSIAEICLPVSSEADRGVKAPKVHRLKGEAGNVSACRLQSAASRLEAALRQGEATSPLIDELQEEADRCLGEIEVVLAKLP